MIDAIVTKNLGRLKISAIALHCRKRPEGRGVG